MRDPRIEKLAHLLVTYSVNVQPGDLVRVRGATVAEPLAVALYREIIKAGGNASVSLTPDECSEIFYREASDEQLGFVNPIQKFEVNKFDCFIGLWGDNNTKALSTTDPARKAIASKAGAGYMRRFLKRAADGDLRWTGTQFPTHAAAQDAEMSLAEYEDFVFSAGLLDQPNPAAAWRKISTRQQRVCDALEKGRVVRFTNTTGTDITIGTKGRKWLNCDGHENFPDGEVFTGPIETATEGVLCVSFPAVHGGREVDGIRLEFKGGRVVDASAEKGEDFLFKMLDQDRGSRILGEAAIGTNYSITRYMRNTLFDEKIGGTFHMALGAAYPESGGKNTSGLHWDLVTDLREGGKIELDGKVISENGRFLDSRWPQPPGKKRKAARKKRRR